MFSVANLRNDVKVFKWIILFLIDSTSSHYCALYFVIVTGLFMILVGYLLIKKSGAKMFMLYFVVAATYEQAFYYCEHSSIGVLCLLKF